jgi:Galactose oxidase, central domain
MRRHIARAWTWLGVLAVLLATATSAAADSWTQLAPSGTPPAPRYSAGNGYDPGSDRLILFSGEDFTGLPRPTDVWALAGATDVDGPSSWAELFPTGGPPFGREGGTTVFDPVSNRLLVHGGCLGNCSPPLADTWALDGANGLAGTPQWTPRQSAPFGRAEHAATFDAATGRMIVFGGHQGFFGTEMNDVHLYDSVADSWTQLLPAGSPPPVRRAAAVAYDASSNRMILVGGLDAPSPFSFTYYNDAWVLTGANGTGPPQWIQLTPAGTPPAARAAHSAVYDAAGNQLIVFGGSVFDPTSGISTTFGDTWVLEHANGLGGTPTWVQLAPTGGPPPARFGHSVGYSSASRRMVVAMGRSDTGAVTTLFNDAWVLSLNEPPDCSGVTATPDTLRPPNHRLQLVTLSGATDPDGDSVTLTITGVTQDEPVDGNGDGDLSPDAAAGSQSNDVQLRSERSGGGDGRVYRIAFTGSDGQGGSCTGTASVGVPRNTGSPAVDSAPPSYDSFDP